MKVILASQNKNKIKEIDAILEKFDMNVISRDDAGLPKNDIIEDGTTFEENSLIKATAIRNMIIDGSFTEYMQSPIIADDSGLMVDALNGVPGVYSARYAGENCTFADNNNKLLSELSGVPYEKRTACFVTVITMLYPDGSTIVARGECPGNIALKQQGDGGFGYDPLFIPEGYDKTFSELGPDLKNKISHRAKALEILENILSSSPKS